MSSYEKYMVRRLKEAEFGVSLEQQEENERAGKEAYGNLDVVNNPAHYNQTGIECIDAIAAATDNGFEHYLQGNIIKYLWRYRYKNGIEDLKKAQWYLNKLIETQGDKT